MLYYFLNYRSLTYAQRTVKVLERAGLNVFIRRTPKTISDSGCGYSIKISSKNFAPSMQVLTQHQLLPKSIYLDDGDGYYREVTF